MPDDPKRPDVSPFLAVRAHELDAIRVRRGVHGHEASHDEIATSLTGLALSGGGIRSATFSLGVLQGLHELGTLRAVDYLSTVSGGGFAGAWWTTWLSRKDFLASHIADEEALAKRLIGERAPGWEQIEAALGAATDRRTDRDRSEARQRLLDLLVQTLSGLRMSARSADEIFERYGTALTRHFPASERIEPDRASEYRNPRLPDGALAAGADPIHHVRLFANYLTPRKGLMSADTWRAVAVVSRNLIFTWCVLLPILLAVVLAGQLYFVAQRFDEQVAWEFVQDRAPVGAPAADDPARTARQRWRDRALVAARPAIAFGAGIVVVALLWIGFNHAGSRWTHATALLGGAVLVAGTLLLAIRPGGCAGLAECVAAVFAASPTPVSRTQRVWEYAFAVVVVLGVGAISAQILKISHLPGAPRATGRLTRAWHHVVALAIGLAAILVGPQYFRLPNQPRVPEGVRRQVGGNQATRWHGTLLAWGVLAVAVFGFAGFAHEAIDWLLDVDAGRAVAAATTLGTIAGSVFTALKATPAAGRDPREAARPALPSRIVFSVTPPLVLLVLAAALAWVGQRVLATVTRDWSVVFPILTVMGLVGVAICFVYGVLEAFDPAAAQWSRRHTVWSVLLGTIVVATVVLLHASTVTPACPSASASWASALAATATAVFSTALGSLYAITTLVIGAVIAWVHQNAGEQRRRAVVLFGFCGATVVLFLFASLRLWCNPSTPTIASYAGLSLLVVVLAWVLTVGWMSDPNALGLHTFYKSRLVRAYLGASNPERHVSGRDIHDAVIGDDLKLADLEPTRAGGPYPLINTTLNLVGGRDLATAQRSAAYFVLSPGFCGSVRTGYRPTAAYMGGQLSVGAAVATSGAAASPNMGSRTPSAALAMLMTLFNVRLGLWVPTPHKVHWASPQARLWPFYLLRESLSQTNDLSSYCYLTDGGHFDNTGLYSLVERACTAIVLVDNGADPRPCFEDLGETIRRCRIDFQAEISLSVTGFQKTHAAGVHYAIGEVTYARPHLRELGIARDEMKGTIVWIKPTVVGTEPADVVQYGLQNAAFPQQTTADQWFDEAQFESYRQLGRESVRAVFTEAPDVLRPRP
ncbi:MAG: patatin-like phospholipase family protein [Candidatus Rokubacteria bacterium]|nr:patatin-like phospholipase family protein [Candidatus Rokubacteria bacterium]